MSDIIDQSDLLGLRPVYRKDLPQKYIAYWEVKLSEANKEKYMIISAGIFIRQGLKFLCQSRAEQSKTEQSRAKQQSRAEQSRAEQSRAE